MDRTRKAFNRNDFDRALGMVGELLQADGHRFQIVIIGGTALNLLGVTARTTTDVDVLALAERDDAGNRILIPPGASLPAPLAEAAETVAADLGLDPGWLNTGPESQWKTGLPPGLPQRVEWRDYGGLSVGIVGRRDLVFFKVYAAADDVGTASVHYQDLLALRPSDDELEAAAEWVASQDPGEEFGRVVREVVEHVRADRQRAGN